MVFTRLLGLRHHVHRHRPGLRHPVHHPGHHHRRPCPRHHLSNANGYTGERSPPVSFLPGVLSQKLSRISVTLTALLANQLQSPGPDWLTSWLLIFSIWLLLRVNRKSVLDIFLWLWWPCSAPQCHRLTPAGSTTQHFTYKCQSDGRRWSKILDFTVLRSCLKILTLTLYIHTCRKCTHSYIFTYIHTYTHVHTYRVFSHANSHVHTLV